MDWCVTKEAPTSVCSKQRYWIKIIEAERKDILNSLRTFILLQQYKSLKGIISQDFGGLQMTWWDGLKVFNVCTSSLFYFCRRFHQIFLKMPCSPVLHFNITHQRTSTSMIFGNVVVILFYFVSAAIFEKNFVNIFVFIAKTFKEKGKKLRLGPFIAWTLACSGFHQRNYLWKLKKKYFCKDDIQSLLQGNTDFTFFYIT